MDDIDITGEAGRYGGGRKGGGGEVETEFRVDVQSVTTEMDHPGCTCMQEEMLKDLKELIQ